MTTVTVRGLGYCLSYLAEHNRLSNAHCITSRTGKDSAKYQDYFIAPEKAKGHPGCFDITVNVVLHRDEDAALGASLVQDKPGDEFVMTTYSGVYHNDVIRALRTFVAANNMTLGDDVDLPPTEPQADKNPKIFESASNRPLRGSNIDDVITLLEATIDRVPVKVLEKAKVTPLNLKDVFDELRWVANRWNIFEYGLVRLAQGKTSEELMTILDARSSVLYWLFDRDNSGPSNEEIIDLCKKSNNPKFTSEITFNIPPGYKGGNPVRLMSEALVAIDKYERNYGPFVPEPEYLLTLETFGTGTRRFVNPAWLDWWFNYSDRTQKPAYMAANPEYVIEERVRASYAGRTDLTNLDVRLKRLVDKELFGDEDERTEVVVSYQAFL